MKVVTALIRFYGWLAHLLFKIGLGKVPGAKRLYGFTRQVLPTAKGTVLLTVQGSKMYVDGRDKDIGFALLVTGVYETYQTQLFKNTVQPGMIVVDVGANIGYYTLLAARLVGSKGIVYAFEPEPTGYELLCKSIAINGYTNIIATQKALSNVSGKTKLYVDPNHIGVSSLARDSAAVYGGVVGCLNVETVTLDDFLKAIGNDKVDVLKVDVEGAEELVLSGAQKVLDYNNLTIFLEFIPEKMRALGTEPMALLTSLKTRGFEAKFINEHKQELEVITDLGKFLSEIEQHKITRNILLTKTA
jgi:FkbM family methyltransferase